MAASTRWFSQPTPFSGGLGVTVSPDGTPDPAPTYGAGAELRVVPAAALRLHVAYAAQGLRVVTFLDPVIGFPTLGPAIGIPVEQRISAHQWLYDVSTVIRPFAASAAAPLRGAWISAGAGAITTSFPGGPSLADARCRADLIGSGICLPQDAITRFQVTGGLGVDLVPLGPGVSLFASATVNVYKPPVRPGSSSDLFLNCATRVTKSTVLPIPCARWQRSAAATTDVVGKQAPAVSRSASTGRATAGVRVTPGRAPTFTPPPPPPPLLGPPTTGGSVVVSTAHPGADVYLVPYNRWSGVATVCTLRPVYGAGSFYQGSTASAVPVNAVISRPVMHYLVVLQGGRYYWDRVQVANNAVDRRTLDMARDGRPTGCR
ncbi:MAG TPA: hypothetical protein VFJ82_08300 [Longimicrobium sp.]|nr:hypothetical protein [Longimicrobium sp.]